MMNEQTVQSFWQDHACGDAQVGGLHERFHDDYEKFFTDYDRFRYKRPAVLVLGTERSGLSDEQRIACQHVVRIPMVGGIDSLNLAVAGSLLMYQVFRS